MENKICWENTQNKLIGKLRSAEPEFYLECHKRRSYYLGREENQVDMVGKGMERRKPTTLKDTIKVPLKQMIILYREVGIRQWINFMQDTLTVLAKLKYLKWL